MKILLVTDYGGPVGGAEILTIRIRDILRQNGHDARILASTARPLGLPSVADYHAFGTTSRFRTLLQTANPAALLTMRRVLREFRPDVVHVRMFLTQLSPLILPALRSVPTFYNVVWYRPICPIGTKLLPDDRTCTVRAGAVCYRYGCLPLRDWAPLMLQMKLWRRWSSVFSLFVAESQSVARKLSAEGLSPVDSVYSGVAPRPMRPPLSQSEPLVGFAGRLVREKGAEVLVRAFANALTSVPAARLVIAGDGPRRAAIERLCQDLGLTDKVRFTGRLDQDALGATLGGAWVQAVPSLWEEPFGLVAAEAAMRGTAVVATQSGGLAEVVVDGGTGYLVPPGDVMALADRLTHVLQNRALAERLGRNGRRRALDQFTEGACVERFTRIYQMLTRGESASLRPALTA